MGIAEAAARQGAVLRGRVSYSEERLRCRASVWAPGPHGEYRGQGGAVMSTVTITAPADKACAPRCWEAGQRCEPAPGLTAQTSLATSKGKPSNSRKTCSSSKTSCYRCTCCPLVLSHPYLRLLFVLMASFLQRRTKFRRRDFRTTYPHHNHHSRRAAAL